MRIEMIAHPYHLGGIGITVIKQVLALVRPVDRGAVCRYVDRTPPRQGLGTQQHVGRPDAFVFIIITLGLARLGWQGRARFLHQLHRLFIPIDKRVPGIIGALLELRDILHVSHKVGLVLWGNHPALGYVWREEVFLRVCRTVA